MKRRNLLIWVLIVLLALSVTAMSSCDNPSGVIPPDNGDVTPGEPEIETKYTVTYEGGEGATGEAPATATCKEGTQIVLSANTFSRENYLFVGWSNGSEIYNAGAVFTTPASDVVFTAVWEEKPAIFNEISSVVLNDMLLTVSGTINGSGAKLCVGVAPDDETRHNYYQDLTVAADGSFTTTFDLNELKADEGWYNVHLLALGEDGEIINIMASLDKLSDGNGGSYAKDTVLTAEYTTVQIRSWEGDGGFNSLSFEVDHDFLKGGKVSVSNVPFALVEEDGKVYVTFDGEFNADNSEKTIELILTYADPSEYPTSIDRIAATVSNAYEGDNVNAFSFKANMTDNIEKNGGWVRFILKVTEGETVTYYTVKPSVPSHNGDWNPLADAIILGDGKYELAICWSSVFVQVVNA